MYHSGDPKQPLNSRCRHWGRNDTAGEQLTKFHVNCHVICTVCAPCGTVKCMEKKMLPVWIFESWSASSRALGGGLLFDVLSWSCALSYQKAFQGEWNTSWGYKNKAGVPGPVNICRLCNKNISILQLLQIRWGEGQGLKRNLVVWGRNVFSEDLGNMADSIVVHSMALLTLWRSLDFLNN